MEEYFCRPLMSLAVRSARSAPSVSAAEYRYIPWPASSCTFAMRIALRRREGLRVVCLGDRADHRAAVGARHPVPGLDPPAVLDRLVEVGLEFTGFVSGKC